MSDESRQCPGMKQAVQLRFMCDNQETKERACKGKHVISTCYTSERVAMQVVQKVCWKVAW